jgi:tRNA A-37 threonylcarbamoyl transferase component Bud32
MDHFTNTVPFSVTLNGSGADNSICCDRLLRHLPGKRLVYRGSWKQRPVIVKLFLDSKSSHRHWAREKAGIEALEKARALTPELIFSGQLSDRTPVLVFNYLPEAETALAVWDRLTTLESRSDLLRQLVTLVGYMHDKGLVQEDLHLENFLISGGRIYAIDGDTVCVENRGEPLNLKTSSRNLALLFAQLPPKFDCLIDSTSQHYAKCRSISHPKLMALLESDLPKIRRRRRCKYVKKSYRSCSEFIRSKGAGQIAISRRDVQSERLERLLDDPDAFMRDGEILKDGNTTTIVRVQTGDCDWVIKRYNIKSCWHILSRCFRPTRAWLSWGNAHRLKISGISTPRAVAMIEKRIGPLRSTGYYVCDFVEGPRTEVLFQDDTVDTDSKELAARGFVLLFELFRKLGIYHGDCKAANFIPKENIPWVLDLDAMRECSSTARFRKLFQEDRQRFLLNWQSQPEWLKWFDQHLPK